MLQRIQSVWLLLAAAFAAITFRFPFYSGERIMDFATGAATHNDLLANSTVGLTILTFLAGATAFITIFFYGNRKLQIRLCYLGIFFTVLLLVLYFLEVGKFVPGKGTFALSCIFHFAILVFYIMAVRGIMKDERLIKSMDRLR